MGKISCFVQTLPRGKRNLEGAIDFISQAEYLGKHIILQCCSNDICRESVAATENKLRAVIDALHDKFPLSQIYVGEALPRLIVDPEYNRNNVMDFNKKLKELETDLNFKVIQHEKLMKPSIITMDIENGDGIHFNETGTAILVSDIKKTLNPILGLTYHQNRNKYPGHEMVNGWTPPLSYGNPPHGPPSHLRPPYHGPPPPHGLSRGPLLPNPYTEASPDVASNPNHDYEKAFKMNQMLKMMDYFMQW